MMSILGKGDDVRSGTKAKAHHNQHGRQWIKKYLTVYVHFIISKFIQRNNQTRSSEREEFDGVLDYK